MVSAAGVKQPCWNSFVYLKRQGVPSARILIYDFDHPANAQQDPTQLFQHIKKRLTRDQVTYLFLDELENGAQLSIIGAKVSSLAAGRPVHHQLGG